MISQSTKPRSLRTFEPHHDRWLSELELFRDEKNFPEHAEKRNEYERMVDPRKIVIRFGKYKGRTVAKTPPTYLVYLLQSVPIRDDVLAESVKHRLRTIGDIGLEREIIGLRR